MMAGTLWNTARVYGQWILFSPLSENKTCLQKI